MQLNELKAPKGSRKRKKLVGRGKGSGLGHTSGRGEKGQGARSGNNMPALGSEGGQMPLIRRLPKVGFTNPKPRVYEAVNLCQLDKTFEAKAEVTAQALKEAKLISSARKKYKILSRGDISKALTIKAYAVSKSAQEKIEKAGGKVVIITNPTAE